MKTRTDSVRTFEGAIGFRPRFFGISLFYPITNNAASKANRSLSIELASAAPRGIGKEHAPRRRRMVDSRKSLAHIAGVLGVHKSTVGREVQRLGLLA